MTAETEKAKLPAEIVAAINAHDEAVRNVMRASLDEYNDRGNWREQEALRKARAALESAIATALSAKPQPAAPETDNRDENGLAPTWRLDLAKRNVSAKIYAAQQGPLEVSLGWLKGLASFLDSLSPPAASVGEVEKAANNLCAWADDFRTQVAMSLPFATDFDNTEALNRAARAIDLIPEVTVAIESVEAAIRARSGKATT